VHVYMYININATDYTARLGNWQ